jgi:hypothetical protein
LTEAGNGDPRIADIFHLAILWWGGDDIQQLLWLVCSIHSQESGGSQETSVTFRHHEWFCENDKVTCMVEEVVVNKGKRQSPKYTKKT